VNGFDTGNHKTYITRFAEFGVVGFGLKIPTLSAFQALPCRLDNVLPFSTTLLDPHQERRPNNYQTRSRYNQCLYGAETITRLAWNFLDQNLPAHLSHTMPSLPGAAHGAAGSMR